MILELEYAIRKGYTYYYHGYCYDVASFYDYKKRFLAMESYNWKETWQSYKFRG